MAGSVLRPNKMCLLSQENLWVLYRLEAGPGRSLLGVGHRPSLSDVFANIRAGDAFQGLLVYVGKLRPRPRGCGGRHGTVCSKYGVGEL